MGLRYVSSTGRNLNPRCYHYIYINRLSMIFTNGISTFNINYCMPRSFIILSWLLCTPIPWTSTYVNELFTMNKYSGKNRVPQSSGFAIIFLLVMFCNFEVGVSLLEVHSSFRWIHLAKSHLLKIVQHQWTMSHNACLE